LVERQPSKLQVAGSSLVSRSFSGCCSSGVEHFLGKEEVEGSIPFNSSKSWYLSGLDVEHGAFRDKVEVHPDNYRDASTAQI
jgi:hypothetical protein